MGEVATTTTNQPDVALVEAAFAGNPAEAEMIQGLLKNGGIPSLLRPTGLNGLLLGIGLLPPSSQRVMVRTSQADAARRLLASTLIEEEQEAGEEVADAARLDEASGRKPRSYGLFGAYARIWLWSLSAVAIAFGVFLLLRIG